MDRSLCEEAKFSPGRALDKYYHYRGIYPDRRFLLKKHNFGKSIIFICANANDYQSGWPIIHWALMKINQYMPGTEPRR